MENENFKKLPGILHPVDKNKRHRVIPVAQCFYGLKNLILFI